MLEDGQLVMFAPEEGELNPLGWVAPEKQGAPTCSGGRRVWDEEHRGELCTRKWAHRHTAWPKKTGSYKRMGLFSTGNFRSTFVTYEY